MNRFEPLQTLFFNFNCWRPHLKGLKKFLNSKVPDAEGSTLGRMMLVTTRVFGNRQDYVDECGYLLVAARSILQAWGLALSTETTQLIPQKVKLRVEEGICVRLRKPHNSSHNE